MYLNQDRRHRAQTANLKRLRRQQREAAKARRTALHVQAIIRAQAALHHLEQGHCSGEISES